MSAVLNLLEGQPWLAQFKTSINEKSEAKSLAKKLTRTTGVQLILVAGSLSILGFSVGRNIAIEQKEAHRAHLPVVRVSERLSSKISFPTIDQPAQRRSDRCRPRLTQRL